MDLYESCALIKVLWREYNRFIWWTDLYRLLFTFKLIHIANHLW